MSIRLLALTSALAFSAVEPVLAQTPLSRGPVPPVATPTPAARVEAASSAVNSTLPVGSVDQAKAQASGNFGPLARPESIGGQIQEAWSYPDARQGVHVQDYCGDCVYKVRLRQFMVSAIQLPKGTKISSADLGDASRFEVKKRSDNTLAVKPTGAGVDSSLLVYTEDGEVYSFYLRSEGINSKSVPDVSFRIVGPDVAGLAYVQFDAAGNPVAGARAAAPAGAPTDFLTTAKFDPDKLRGWTEYKLWGDKQLRPEQVFRDDHFTYIQFGDKWTDLELPTAYVVVDGIDELVNTRVQGTTFVVESTHRLITLKSGQSFMCIQYRGD